MNSLSCSLYIDNKDVEADLLSQIRQTSSIEIKHVFNSNIEIVEHLQQKVVDILFISKSFEHVLTSIIQPPFIIAIEDEKQNSNGSKNHLFFDILTHPFDEQSLCNTLAKLLKIANAYRPKSTEMLVAAERKTPSYFTTNTPQETDYMFIKNGRTSLKLVFNEILFVKNVGNQVQIYLENSKPVFHRSTLKRFYERLPMDSFARINKSVVVNFTKITSFQNYYVWVQQDKFPVSRIYIVRLRELLRLKNHQ